MNTGQLHERSREMRPAIILSGHTMGLAVTRALGSRGVPIVLIHHDDRDMAQVSRYVTTAIRAPHPEKETEAFIGCLRDCAPRFRGGIIFPTSDEALVIAAKYKCLLEKDFIVACPEWEVTRRCIDKHLTYDIAAEAGIPAPRTLAPRSWKEIKGYAATAEFPCLVKPCQSHLFYAHFQCKMVRVDTPAQLFEVCERAAEAGLDILLQELIPGGDELVVNYNAYAWGGESLTEFTARHIRNAPPWFGSPRVVCSEEIPEVLPAGRAMLQALGFYGYACSEFKQDPRSGVYKLMEVNGRHNLSTLLAGACGINFPWLHYRHLDSGEAPAAATSRPGVYWIDLTRDLGYSAICLTRERYRVIDYLRPYLRPHVFAILDRKDLRPFRRRVAYLTRQGLGRICQRLRLSRRRPEPAPSPPPSTRGATSW